MPKKRKNFAIMDSQGKKYFESDDENALTILRRIIGEVKRCFEWLQMQFVSHFLC